MAPRQSQKSLLIPHNSYTPKSRVKFYNNVGSFRNAKQSNTIHNRNNDSNHISNSNLLKDGSSIMRESIISTNSINTKNGLNKRSLRHVPQQNSNSIRIDSSPVKKSTKFNSFQNYFKGFQGSTRGRNLAYNPNGKTAVKRPTFGASGNVRKSSKLSQMTQKLNLAKYKKLRSGKKYSFGG
jgi:hypothetical protein